ncbi:MAG: hypothetical protein H6623_00505 [Bdellovibrionaceae bacterium]|nr:hypothetical protein [Pseudobdellovibrionaceae bacterium]
MHWILIFHLFFLNADPLEDIRCRDNAREKHDRVLAVLASCYFKSIDASLSYVTTKNFNCPTYPNPTTSPDPAKPDAKGGFRGIDAFGNSKGFAGMLICKDSYGEFAYTCTQCQSHSYLNTQLDSTCVENMYSQELHYCDTLASARMSYQHRPGESRPVDNSGNPIGDWSDIP